MSIPIRISPLFWVIAFLLGFSWSGGDFTLAMCLMGVVAVSVLIHEFGHALTGIAFGQKVSVSLLPFGGLTERKGPPLKGWQEFLIILLGPGFGFLLYLAAKALAPQLSDGLFKQVVVFTAAANLFWTIVNLLPILPMDGGQLMRVILQSVWGTKGLRTACILSMFFGIAFALLAIFNQDFLIASIFAIFVYESWQTYQSVKYLTDDDQNVELQRLMVKGEKALEHGEMERAKEIFTSVRSQLKKGVLYNRATYCLARIANHEHNVKEVYTLLNPIRDELSLEGINLYHQAAMLTEAWAEALNTGQKLYEYSQSPQLAKDNSIASRALGDHTAAEGWAKRGSSDR
jgi:Zn-dependent protease